MSPAFSCLRISIHKADVVGSAKSNGASCKATFASGVSAPWQRMQWDFIKRLTEASRSVPNAPVPQVKPKVRRVTVEIRRNICNQVSLRVMVKGLGQPASSCRMCDRLEQESIVLQNMAGNAEFSDRISQPQWLKAADGIHTRNLNTGAAGVGHADAGEGS